MKDKILLRNVGIPNSTRLDTYRERGGYRAIKKALDEFSPADLIQEVTKSGLRGRGGAGFPTGIKWSFVPKDSSEPVYLCCNADESEPGTFKDRVLMENDPHQLLEGIMVSCYALNSHTCYIYIRGEFARIANILQQAINEAYQNGYLGKNILGKGFDLDIYIHLGAGAYICGDETGLLESLEGKRGWPRLKPPFPTDKGVFQKPTIINNVETLSNIPHIVLNGADWYASIGTDEKNTGTKLYCLSGHVKNPGVFEFPIGISLRELIFTHGGGMRNGNRLKGVIPGGASTAILKADEIEVNMDFDSLARAGTALGSAGVMVMDESVCIVNAALNIAKFFAHESCGQCTPCREGTTWIAKILRRIEHGEGVDDDPDVILDICENIVGQTICGLGDGFVFPIRSIVTKFRKEFDEHIEQGECPFRSGG